MNRWPYVVTVHSAGVGVDEYGNPIPSAFTSATARGDMQPVTTAEVNDGLARVDTDEVRFFFPPGTVVESTDRLECAGETFEVVGPAVVRDTGSPLDYVRVRATRSA